MRLADDFGDTRVALPPRPFKNILSGESVDGGERPVADVLARFPVGLLEA